jgi:transcriptional regulator with XRE-family HTH domain
MTGRALLRRRAAMTQQQLAAKVGISASYLCLWELGKVELSRQLVDRIADSLHQAIGETPCFSDAEELMYALKPALSEPLEAA